MTIIVTGAAGFIGANIVQALNKRGETDILAVDDLTDGDKCRNLVDCDISHYMDKEDFRQALLAGELEGTIRAIFHQGACSDTMSSNGRVMMENNYQYTLDLFQYCQQEEIAFLYASSAAVYGNNSVFKEARQYEAPLNVYGYSKWLFDQVVRQYQHQLTAQAVGLRYFNVYGPKEQHKDRMASVAFHHFNQYQRDGKVKLFRGYAGYGDGEQQRDFISIEDVVKVNLYFFDHPEKHGIFNLGTGCAQSFNEVAMAVVNTCRAAENKSSLSLDKLIEQGIIEYTPFPEALKGKYQSFTQADIAQLRMAGYTESMLTVQEGIKRYVEVLLR